MELWHAWTGLLQTMLHTLAVDWGLGAGLAVIALTLAIRAALMPLTWSLAYRAMLRQTKLSSLEPQLRAIRDRHHDDPRAQMQHSLELYRRHGLKVADGKGVLGGLVQVPVIYGLYQTLRGGLSSAAFLWIRDLARPDLGLAIFAALTTALVMAVAPQMSEQVRWTLILVPALFCLAAALHLSSGIALYWITSNAVSTAQSLALRRALHRARGPLAR
jgi:YidC/Oxa1 family membrane protein insertase